MKLFLIVLAIIGSARAQYCWSPGTNPFTGPPKVIRTQPDRVVVDWSKIFSSNIECQNVDFLIKSHPRYQPSAYKLSDFTNPGIGSATIKVDGEADFVFQVIARENKGPLYGIEYKYSQLVTSFATDFVESARSSRPQPMKRPQTRNLDRRIRPIKTSLKSLDQCMPIWNVGGQNDPHNLMRTDRIVINFVRYMNQKPADMLSEFMLTKKTCSKDGPQKGFVSMCKGVKMCCPSPADASKTCQKCSMDFATCDGKCIPRSWVGDGWPDCLDGSDETSFEDLGYKLQCVQCSGVIWSAANICSKNQQNDLSLEECVDEILGEGQCNVCVSEILP